MELLKISFIITILGYGIVVGGKELNLMVVGGYSDEGMVADVELLDPFSPESHCEKPINFSEPRYGMIGEFFTNYPIICGGMSTEFMSYRNDCDVYDKNVWVNGSFSLTAVRAQASSVLINDEVLWVSGGIDGVGNASTYQTSDIIYSSGLVEPGPDMPEYIAFHCSAKINSTHVFIAGNGYWDPYAYNAYIVDTTTNPFTFIKLPSMLHARHGAACATVNIRESKEDEYVDEDGIRLLVVGGWDHPSWTEMYSFSEDKWIEGPELPRGFSAGGYVTYPDERGFILVGGTTLLFEFKDDIMRYNVELNMFEILPGKMKLAREYFGAILIETDEPC